MSLLASAHHVLSFELLTSALAQGLWKYICISNQKWDRLKQSLSYLFTGLTSHVLFGHFILSFYLSQQFTTAPRLRGLCLHFSLYWCDVPTVAPLHQTENAIVCLQNQLLKCLSIAVTFQLNKNRTRDLIYKNTLKMVYNSTVFKVSYS